MFNLGSSYFHVPLTTVRHLLNVAYAHPYCQLAPTFHFFSTDAKHFPVFLSHSLPFTVTPSFPILPVPLTDRRTDTVPLHRPCRMSCEQAGAIMGHTDGRTPYRYIDPAACHASKPTWDIQTDRRTDTVPLHRPCRMSCQQAGAHVYRGSGVDSPAVDVRR